MNDDVTAAYRRLRASAARTLRLLTVFPGRAFSLPGAAAMLDCHEPAARTWLDELTDAGLLARSVSGWWGIPEGVADMAAHQASEQDTTGQSAALARLLVTYLRYGVAASHRLEPNLFRLGWNYRLHDDSDLRFPSDKAAIVWLDSELDNVLAAQQAAMDAGRPDVVWMLTEVYWVWCQIRRQLNPWMTFCERAIAAAEQYGDPVVHARMLGLHIQACNEALDHKRARSLAQRMYRIACASGDWFNRVSALEAQGADAIRAGHPEHAVKYLEEALGIVRRHGSRPRSTGLVRRVLARAHARLHNTGKAHYHLDLAFEQFSLINDTHQLQRTLIERARIELDAGEPVAAVATAEQALANHGDLPYPLTTAEAHLVAAQAHHHRASNGPARERLDLALDIYEAEAHEEHPPFVCARQLDTTLNIAS